MCGGLISYNSASNLYNFIIDSVCIPQTDNKRVLIMYNTQSKFLIYANSNRHNMHNKSKIGKKCFKS